MRTSLVIEGCNLTLLFVLVGVQLFSSEPENNQPTSPRFSPGRSTVGDAPATIPPKPPRPGFDAVQRSSKTVNQALSPPVPAGWMEADYHRFLGSECLLDADGSLNPDAASTIELPPNQLTSLQQGLKNLADVALQREAANASTQMTDDGEEIVVQGSSDLADRAREILTAQMQNDFSAEEIAGYHRLIMADKFYSLSTNGFRFSIRDEADGSLWLDLNSPPTGPGRGGSSLIMPSGRAQDITNHGPIRRFRHLWKQ